MTGLAILGGLVVIVFMPVLEALASVYSAYWAIKIWDLLVVPAFGWPTLPMAGVVGIVLAYGVLRPTRPALEDKDKSVWEGLGSSLFIMAFLGPLTYLIALVVARIVL